MNLQNLSLSELKTYAEQVRRDYLAARTLDEIAAQTERYRPIQEEAARRLKASLTAKGLWS